RSRGADPSRVRPKGAALALAPIFTFPSTLSSTRRSRATTDTFVSLAEARDESRYGGKAGQLALAVRARLPVPAGLACSWQEAARLVGARASRDAALARVLAELGAPLAVRSSAIGEDSKLASFAGQHATVLGVRTARELRAAIAEVVASAAGPGAAAYR